MEWQLIREATDGEQPAEARRFFKAYGRDVDVSEGLMEYEEEARRLTLAGGSRRQTAADSRIPDVLGYLDAHPGASQNSIEEGLKGSQARRRESGDQGGGEAEAHPHGARCEDLDVCTGSPILMCR